MNYIFRYSLLTFLIICFFGRVKSQTNISGVINNYSSVTGIGSQTVSVSTALGFAIGDKVLLIQMKGASIDTTNTSNFGTINAYNDAGNYEMLVISAISSTTITFTNPILRTYNVSGLLQLVKVPVYNNVNVIGVLTCLPWNGLTGGVLIFEANGNVTLNASIDVTGKGFLGGAKLAGQLGSCVGNTTGFKLPIASLLSTNKGEGITIIKPSFAKGLGALANGGGAGNDVNGGGAGGGNYGLGGHGGNSKCSSSSISLCGGREGKNCLYSNANNKIFLGGGGGAGHENDGISTGGVAGGGIVIIRCGGAISGNGNTINSNGNNNTLIAGNDGQGGGGAGGTVLIEACSISSLNISVTGGNGGTDNFSGPDCHGKGGGGGGGVIWTSTALSYTSFLNGGNPGVYTNASSQCFNTSNGATSGLAGGILTGLVIPGATSLSSVGNFSLTTSSNCISNNNSTATATIFTNEVSPIFSYTWTNSSGAIVSQTNNTTSLTNAVTNLTNGVYTLSVQMNAPCGPVNTLTLNINCVITPTVPCLGTLTGTGMSICNQYSFNITPTQTITPFNYGSQGYVCNGTTQPDVSFNIMGSTWRVNKFNWNFTAPTNGFVSGYTSTGIFQSFPFAATNTITPLSYSGSFVQFAINGVATGSLLSQSNFSISLHNDVFTGNSYTYCASTSTSIAISPISPTTGGPWAYNWLPGNLNGSPVNVSPLTNTIYSVTAISPGGCSTTATIVVTLSCSIAPIALFSSPDTVCVNQSFSVSNLSTGANSYYWTFCQGNTATAPQAINLGNVGFFNGPVFITIAKEGSDYYAFVTNNSSSTLTKLFFGSSLLNLPVATNLGNISGAFPGSLEDIHIEYEGGNWYGIAVGGFGGGEAIIRINFGNSLANTPTAVNYGNIGGLNYPQRLKIFKNGANYYGFTTNRNNNTVTRFSFGNSIANIPTGVNMGNIGALNTPDAIAIVNVASMWYGYIINEGNNTITRLDFGNSLLNTPIATNIGNTGALNGPRGIDMWTECNEVRGLITNRFSNDLLNMNLSSGPTGPVVTSSFGNIANFSFPHSITRFRSGDTLFAFITNVSNNTLSRIYYPGCVNSSIASSTLPTPPAISYNAPGNYYINVVTNEGQITQSSYCKQVTVIASPTVVVSNANICAGSTASLTVNGANSYSWTASPSLSSSTGSLVIATPSVSESYTVTGFIGSCTNTAVSSVTIIPSPSITITPTLTTICSGQTSTLTASGANTYTWNSSLTLSSNSGSLVVANPITTTIYTVSGTLNTCTNTAITTVSVVPIPTLTISSNTVICLGSNASTTLTANGASSYAWVNSSSLSSPTGSIVIASPNVNTTYTVTGITASCSNTAVITLSVNPSPTITAVSFTNTSCGLNNGSIIITSSPINNSYNWSGGITSTTNTASSLASGIYSITVTNGSCPTATVVNVLSSVPLLITSSTITPTDCDVNNGSITVTDNYANSNYSWSPNVSLTNTASNLPASNYALTISNGACSTSTVFVVSQFSAPTLLNVIQSDVICESINGKINIVSVVNGTAPYQYNFNNIGFSSTSTYSNLAQGTYTITVKDTHGCLYTQLFSIDKTMVNLTLDLITNSPTCDNNDGSYVINKFTSGTPPYLTSFNNGVYTSNLIFDNLGVGAYTLSIRDSNMCETGYVLTLQENGDYTLYIPNTFTPNNNKVNDIWYVKGTCLEEFNCLIFNRWGEKIKELTDIKDGWDGTYKGNPVPDGVYVYVIEAKSKKEAIKKSGHITIFR